MGVGRQAAIISEQREILVMAHDSVPQYALLSGFLFPHIYF